MKERYLTTELTSQFKTLANDGIEIVSENKKLTLPTTLASAVSLRHASPTSRIIAGATDIGVLVNKAKTSLQEILVLNKVSELHKIENTPTGVFIGAQVSLTDVEEFVRTSHPELKRLLHIFASPQIKNQGTLLGNILNGSPIGDSIPALMALDAEIQFASNNGTRKVALKSYYKGYKVFDKTDDEIATGILIPALKGEYLSRFFKVSLRKDLDISAVTFAAVLKVQDGTLAEARIAMGGVGPCVIRLPQVEQLLVGKAFNEKTFADAGVLAASLITPISDLRASREYRQLVTENLFKKCFHELSVETPVAEVVCP
jgi:xanthine dehydrogenase small subunit